MLQSFDLRGWELRDVQGGVVLLRPGAGVLQRRMLVFAVAVAALIPLWMLHASAPDITRMWTLRQSLGQVGEMADTVLLTAAIRQGLLLIMLGVVAVGLLAPLSCLWSCVRIEMTPRGDLSLFRQGVLFPTTHTWPKSAFDRIVPIVGETTRSTRYGRYQVYRCAVALTPTLRGGGPLRFRMVEQAEPFAGRLPHSVQRFAAALENLTGLRANGFDAVLPDFISGAGNVQVVAGEPIVSRQVFTSTDDIPPELRDQFEQLKARAKQSGSTLAVSETITITENGVTRSYHALDEMPPDVRARFEHIRNLAENGNRMK